MKKKQYFQEHPTKLIGVQSYGKSFNEIYAPIFFNTTQPGCDPGYLLTNPNEEENHGSSEIAETEESTNNLS